MVTILGYTFENIWTTCIVSAIHESRNLKQARPKGQYVDLLRRALATPSWEFIDKVYHYIRFLSNYIGNIWDSFIYVFLILVIISKYFFDF